MTRPDGASTSFWTPSSASDEAFAVGVLAVITAATAWFWAANALQNANFLEGDALAPFSVFDQFYHHESVDLSRQSWLLPWTLANVLRLYKSTISYHSLFGAYAVATALASGLTVPVVYVLARRFVGPLEAVLPALFLALNTSFGLHALYPNPTQFYALAFTLSLLAFADRRVWLALLFAGIGMMIRIEGALLVLLIGAWSTWRRDWRPLAAACAAILAMLAIQTLGSATPFGFLINTQAAKPVGALLNDQSVDRLQAIVGALNWKFEKLHAIALNLTMPGLMLAAIGGWLAVRDRPTLGLAPLYLLAYEAVMLVYTLAVPIGNIVNPGFSTVLSVGPVDRYYEILSPIASVFVYLGLRAITEAMLPWVRSAIIAILFALYGLHQLVTFSNTFAATDQHFADGTVVSDAIKVSEYFRHENVRSQDIVLARETPRGLQYVNVIPANGGTYQFHVFHLAILSGHNRVNCTGDNLDNPNLFCSVLQGNKAVKLTPSIRWLVLQKPVNRQEIPARFRPVHETKTFAIFNRP